MKRRHLSEVACFDEIGSLEPVARREDAVTRRRRPAALDVTEHRDARLVARPLLDLPAERLADATEPNVSELVGRRRFLGDRLSLARGVGQLVAFADDDDREVLAPVVALAQGLRTQPRP